MNKYSLIFTYFKSIYSELIYSTQVIQLSKLFIVIHSKSNYELIVNGINAAGLSIKITDFGDQGSVNRHDEASGTRPKPRTKGTYRNADGTTQEVWRGDIHVRSEWQ